MFNQKGQIHFILLAVFVIGLIIYANLSDKSLFKSFLTSPGEPASGQKTKISAPSTQKKPSSTPIPSSTPSGPDTVPPKRLNPQPKDKSSLPVETREVVLSLQTDEKAICRYGDATGTDFEAMQGDFEQTDGTVHSTPITALSEGGKYRYFIRCKDEEGNKNTDDLIISFEVKLPEDKTPPILSNPSHQGSVLPAGTKEAVISISTNEQASCRYSTKAGTSYNSMSGRLSTYDQTKRFHVKNITGLQNGQAYDFFVRCQDMHNNSNTGDVLISFSIALQ